MTKLRCLEICLELWEWLAKTGRLKSDWPEWKKYGKMRSECPCCEWVHQHGKKCYECPLKLYAWIYECMVPESIYIKWVRAWLPKTRKKHARKMVEAIKEAINDLT